MPIQRYAYIEPREFNSWNIFTYFQEAYYNIYWHCQIISNVVQNNVKTLIGSFVHFSLTNWWLTNKRVVLHHWWEIGRGSLWQSLLPPPPPSFHPSTLAISGPELSLHQTDIGQAFQSGPSMADAVHRPKSRGALWRAACAEWPVVSAAWWMCRGFLSGCPCVSPLTGLLTGPLPGPAGHSLDLHADKLPNLYSTICIRTVTTATDSQQSHTREKLTQCRFNVGPPSQTVDQH